MFCVVEMSPALDTIVIHVLFQRQEMEANMTKRLKRYKDALEDTTQVLVEANKELDLLQPVIDELEM